MRKHRDTSPQRLHLQKANPSRTEKEINGIPPPITPLRGESKSYCLKACVFITSLCGTEEHPA